MGSVASVCVCLPATYNTPPSSAVEAQGLSVSLGFYGFLWVSMGFYGFLLVSLSFFWATERLDRGTSFSFCSSRPMQTHADHQKLVSREAQELRPRGQRAPVRCEKRPYISLSPFYPPTNPQTQTQTQTGKAKAANPTAKRETRRIT